MAAYPLYLVTGGPAAGKTTVARALAKRFPRGVQFDTDVFIDQVVSGRADPFRAWDAEAAAQFELARRAAARGARLYAEAGYAVTVADGPAGDLISPYKELFGPGSLRVVLLCPAQDVLQRRIEARESDPARRDGLRRAADLMWPRLEARRAELAAAGWQTLDNSALTVEATVDAILSFGA